MGWVQGAGCGDIRGIPQPVIDIGDSYMVRGLPELQLASQICG